MTKKERTPLELMNNELMLQTCWEIALVDSVSRLVAQRFRDPQKIPNFWWDPNTEGSEVVEMILREHASTPGRDPGFEMLADYVGRVRKKFEEYSPEDVRIKAADDYGVTLTIVGEEGLEDRVLAPINDVVEEYSEVISRLDEGIVSAFTPRMAAEDSSDS